MENIARSILEKLGESESLMRQSLLTGSGNISCRPESLHRLGAKCAVAVVRNGGSAQLLCVALREKFLPDGFTGNVCRLPGGGAMQLCDAGSGDGFLRQHFPWCRAAAESSNRFPVGKICPWMIFEKDFRGGYAITADAANVSELAAAVKSGASIVCKKFLPGDHSVGEKLQHKLEKEYNGRTFVLDSTTAVVFDADEGVALGRRYAGEISVCAEMWTYLQKFNRDVRLEISADGTAKEHLFAARELLMRKISFSFAVNGGENVEIHRKIAAAIGRHPLTVL